MELPDHSDALPRKQPSCNSFEQCDLSHVRPHRLVRNIWMDPKQQAQRAKVLTSSLLVPRVGFEPTTYRLRSGCSTAELPGRRDRHATAVDVPSVIV
jgi:hypothetical protein